MRRSEEVRSGVVGAMRVVGGSLRRMEKVRKMNGDGKRAGNIKRVNGKT